MKTTIEFDLQRHEFLIEMHWSELDEGCPQFYRGQLSKVEIEAMKNCPIYNGDALKKEIIARLFRESLWVVQTAFVQQASKS